MTEYVLVLNKFNIYTNSKIKWTLPVPVIYITREANETIQKIYYKQKEETYKGDWFDLLKKDFEFLEEEMIEEKIKGFPKSEYKKHIKSLINKAVLKHYLVLKEGHSKLDEVSYTQLKTQSYLSTKFLKNQEKELLFNLRSKCHSSKTNFRKMNQNNLRCTLNCQNNEDQRHVFIHCEPVLKLIKNRSILLYEDIFGSLEEQTQVIRAFIHIEKTRKHIIKNHLLPGGGNCQDPCTYDFSSNGATDY